MSSSGVFGYIRRSMPTPAWVRWPEQQRFCCCCTVRTGASVIGWFNFIINSLYIGILVFALAQVTNIIKENWKDILNAQVNQDAEGSTSVIDLPTTEYDTPPMHLLSTKLAVDYVQNEVIPTMYKSVAVPGIMIIFSVLWLTAVESRAIKYVRYMGKAFIIAIIVQLFLQLGFLAYAEYRSKIATGLGISWFLWLVFVVYALLNIYFIPVINEYVRRRIKEWSQGLDQGLLTEEMYPKARVAEAYIEDAFTLEGDADVVKFQASLESVNDSAKHRNQTAAEGGYQQL